MAWSYNHKTNIRFWTNDPKYIPANDIRMGETFKDTGYGFKDTTVTHKQTEYATSNEAEEAREEHLKEQQIARNKAEAEQREINERIGKEISCIKREIKHFQDLQKRTDHAPGDFDFYSRQIKKLQKRLRTIT